MKDRLPRPTRSRTLFAATHIVMSEAYRRGDASPSLEAAVDWESTARLRLHLDALGYGIAEAMDTAQRFEIGWRLARRLIKLCGGLTLHRAFVAGAGYDQRAEIGSLKELIDAVTEQATFIHGQGGTPVILPMPWLCEHRASAADYRRVYGGIADAIEGQAIVHWLGEAFMPSLAGYFPASSFLDVMQERPRVFIGAKLSLLDPARERKLRGRLHAAGQVVFTGDDWNFGELISGGAGYSIPPIKAWSQLHGEPLALGDFSHALLGVLGAIARPAARAFASLEQGDLETYRLLIEPCQSLGRRLFAPPIPAYKAGVAFMSWLDGRSPRLALPFHAENSRPRSALIEMGRFALAAGLFDDEDLATARLIEFEQPLGTG